MKNKVSPPIYGIITGFSFDHQYVQKGKHFCFDGKTITIFFDHHLEQSQLMKIRFNNLSETPDEVEGIIEGVIRPSGEYVAFHVSCHPGISKHSIALGAITYWILYDGASLNDVGRLCFESESVDSFCPMTNLKTDISEGRYVITATTCQENVIDLGTAIISNKSIAISAEAFWFYGFRRNIEFKSHINIDVNKLDYEQMKRIYISVTFALRFCLGRGNIDLTVSLCRSTPQGWEIVGEFTAIHGKTYISDEYDERDVSFVRAQNVRKHFGTLVSAFDRKILSGKALSENREDSQLITFSKVIELTSSFEYEFREIFPEGVKHSSRTQKAHEEAKSAVLNAAEGLSSAPKRIVKRLSERIEDDSLEARIRYACKNLSPMICDVVFEKSSVNRKNTQLGKKIATMRNDIAHGNKPRYELSDIRNEYKLLVNLVFVMRLIRVGIPDDESARLLRAMG